MPSVLITGASKGIGRAIATELAGRGHRVIATARDPRSLDDLDVDRKLRLDVTDQESVDAAIAAAGDIEVLISNAGVIVYGAVEETPPSELERLYAQNTSGAIRVVQAVLPQMRERGAGRLLFMSSVVGRIVRPGGSGYAATKWALEALVESLAVEVRHWGITATLLEPGAVSSGALDDVTTYRLDGAPYAPLFAQTASSPASMITPDAVAKATADAVEMAGPPLRLPIGEPARTILGARKVAPDDRPFLPAPLDW